MNHKEEYKKKVTSIEGAAKLIKSNDFIGIGLGPGACSTNLYDAILDRHEELENVIISDVVQIRPSKLYDPNFMKDLQGRITYAPGFGVGTIRNINKTKIPDYYIVTARDLMEKMSTRCDVFIHMVTPPNSQGYVNLGLSNFYSMESIRMGRASGKQRLTIGEVNENMPVVYGDNWMHISEFDVFVENNTPIPTFGRGQPTEKEQTIANYVLELINDGDTIQMGIGGIPEAVVAGLEGRKDLGVITEMFPIGLPQLVEQGIVTNTLKPLHKGKTVATFCMGDQSMYDYVNENPACEFYPSSYTNNPRIICQHPSMVALNMAMMVDFSGQINAEGDGHTQISGPGGQFDFVQGAYWSEGGKSITLINATRKEKDGSLVSCIVPELPLGSPVSVPRIYAHYVITEFGIANLRYKTRRERALELISIAHPDLRGELKKSLNKAFYMS